jgi:hypothetical protein
MFGEFLREAAVRVAVFSPLDLVLSERPLTPFFVASTLGLVALLPGVGIYLGVETDG